MASDGQQAALSFRLFNRCGLCAHPDTSAAQLLHRSHGSRIPGGVSRPEFFPSRREALGVRYLPLSFHPHFEVLLITRCCLVCLVRVLLVRARLKGSTLLNSMLILCISMELATNLNTSSSAAFCQFIYWEKSW